MSQSDYLYDKTPILKRDMTVTIEKLCNEREGYTIVFSFGEKAF